MGLFDSIICKYKLPLPSDLGELSAADFAAADYQTKDMDNSMSVFEIREDGSLWAEKFEGEWKDGNKGGKSIMDRIGHFNRTKEWWEPYNYTGEVNFYSSVPDWDKDSKDKYQNDYWVDYFVKFVNGKIDGEVRVKMEKTSNAGRKEMEVIHKERDRLEEEFYKTLFYRLFYRFYSGTLNWTFRKVNRLNNWLCSALPRSYKVKRFLDFAGNHFDRKSGVTKMRKEAQDKYKLLP